MSIQLLVLLPLDETNELFLQLALSPGFLEVFQTAEVEDYITRLSEVHLRGMK